jgi:hypothetical protein
MTSISNEFNCLWLMATRHSRVDFLDMLLVAPKAGNQKGRPAVFPLAFSGIRLIKSKYHNAFA